MDVGCGLFWASCTEQWLWHWVDCCSSSTLQDPGSCTVSYWLCISSRYYSKPHNSDSYHYHLVHSSGSNLKWERIQNVSTDSISCQQPFHETTAFVQRIAYCNSIFINFKQVSVYTVRFGVYTQHLFLYFNLQMEWFSINWHHIIRVQYILCLFTHCCFTLLT